jgi:hypothetical protein
MRIDRTSEECEIRLALSSIRHDGSKYVAIRSNVSASQLGMPF